MFLEWIRNLWRHMALCSRIQNPIGQLRTVTILYTFAFIIARHSCHRYVYIMVIVIFDVVSCTINFFIKMYLLSPFFIIFWWLGTFCNHVIFRSTFKVILRDTFHFSIGWNINRATFFLFLSNPFETFFWRVINTSKNVHFVIISYALSLFLTKPDLLSIFR